MKKIIAFLLGILLSATGFSQACLPEGITFSTQTQIDSFQVNYPDCTYIEGNVIISGDSSITNLLGLNMLNQIDGNLQIYNNLILNSLTGLENLEKVNGNVDIGFYINTALGNPMLTNLTGLNNLKSVGWTLSVRYNDAIIDFVGLENLDSIGFCFYIYSNASLINLTGLNSLSNIAKDFQIYNNGNLIDLTGLSSLASISGALKINLNPTLISLNGLDGLSAVVDGILIIENPSLISLAGLESLEFTGFLTIINNISLSTCNVDGICNFLASPNGTITIYGNNAGCNNAPQIANACDITFTCLPYGDYYFLSQNDLDSFQFYYPSCSELNGRVFIKGEDIKNLLGLNIINSIEGDFVIWHNDSLTSLVGLNNLSSVTGDFNIGTNNALTTLEGLNNLASVNGSFYIGGIDYGGNSGLMSLNGLENLTSVDYLDIEYNNSLITLDGIENINEDLYPSVTISHNHSLSFCQVESICNILSDEGDLYASDNAIGCNDEDEILVACGLGLQEDPQVKYTYSLYPNPASTKITFETTAIQPKCKLIIFNLNGQEVIRHLITESQTVIDISQLPKGIYFVKLTSDNTVKVFKIVKQ